MQVSPCSLVSRYAFPGHSSLSAWSFAEFFNITQELTAEPHLPGFRIPVAEIFAD